MKRRGILILLLQVAVVLAVLGAAGTVGFLEYSAQPGFCNNCHNMEPYYESWLQSSHNMVPCIQCHYAPGIKAEAMGKVQAANQVVKYVTRSFGEKPWAEIEDAACTREGCHLEQRLAVVSYMGVRFDHRQHLGELRRGKDLRCTSCHSQIVQGEHLTVTSSSCNLCHFKDRDPGQPLGGCLGCHPYPPNVEYQGVPVDHQQIVRDLVSCSKCHSDMAEGDGAAEEERCWGCHNLPERVGEFENTTLIHSVHIAEHNVACDQCHTTIQHKVVELSETLQLDCGNCHRGAHSAQQAMVSGSGGHGVEENPSRMFLARVTCESCHALPGDLPGHEGVSQAGEATCLSCHGIQFAGILPGWQEELRTREDAVSRAVSAVRRALGPRSAEPSADSLIRAAEENLQLVEVGRGAHNVPYADELLRAAVEMAREAAEAGGVNPRLASVSLGRPIAEGGCMSCHFGVDGGGEVTWEGRRFPHRRHTVNAGFDCMVCHTPIDEHGGLTLTGSATCDACHHRSDSPRACGFCHSAPGGDTLSVAGGGFVHPPHLEMGFTCDLCHQSPAMAVAEETCTGCHELHHTAGTDCSLCHGGGPVDSVVTETGTFYHAPHVTMGLGCETCHEGLGPVAAEVCAGCHSLHHSPSADCRLCHQTDAGSNHRPEMAHTVACTLCHSAPDQAGLTEWSRTVCLVCHQDREEHSGGMECTLCHEIPPLGGGGGS
ncbi:NapC/NirT family cytochrome c [Gemmatimonadota bacterium]